MTTLSAIDSADHSQLLLASNITASLSFFGGCWIFFSFYMMGNLMTHSRKMILCLNISYFIYTITNLIMNFNEIAEPGLCKTEGFLRTFAVLSAFFWAWKISQTAYLSIIDPYYRAGEHSNFLKLARGFILPLLISAIPLIGFSICSYQYIGPHCGVSAENNTVAFVMYLIIDILPPVISLLWTAYFAFKIMRVSRTWGEIGISPLKLFVYPFGLTAVWFPTLLSMSLSYFNHDSLALEIIRISLSNSLGFIHAVIYTIQTRRLLQLKDEKSDSQQATLQTQILETSRTNTSCELNTRSRTSSEDLVLVIN